MTAFAFSRAVLDAGSGRGAAAGRGCPARHETGGQMAAGCWPGAGGGSPDRRQGPRLPLASGGAVRAGSHPQLSAARRDLVQEVPEVHGPVLGGQPPSAPARTSSTMPPPEPPSQKSPRPTERSRDTLNTRPRPAPPGGAAGIMDTLTGNDAAAPTLNDRQHARGTCRSKEVGRPPTGPSGAAVWI